MPFNIHDIANKLAPAAGVVAVVVSIVLGVLSHLGYFDNVSSSREDNHNVVIRVTDQHGLPRFCSVSKAEPVGNVDGKARATGSNGVYSDSLAPGATVTLRFDCSNKKPGTQVADVEVSVPQTGVFVKDITIPNPDSPLASSK